jgi:hypothetical protein
VATAPPAACQRPTRLPPATRNRTAVRRLPLPPAVLATDHWSLPTVHFPLPSCKSIHRTEVFCVWQRVIKVALHFPASHIEPAAGATVQTRSVGLPIPRERPTHFPVPTTKNSRNPIADPAPRRSFLQSVRKIYLNDLLRLHRAQPLQCPICRHHANAQKNWEKGHARQISFADRKKSIGAA